MLFRIKKIKFGQEIFYGNVADDLPYVQLSTLDEEVMVSYSGPDTGLMYAESPGGNSKFTLSEITLDHCSIIINITFTLKISC